MTDLDVALSAERLASAYRRRRALSPVEVTELFLDRIERFDGDVRSMVTVTGDLARRQAERAARRIADGDPSPLLGIPLVVKDLIDVRGVRTTAGSAVLRDNVARRSSVVWRRLERAGAVLLGKANTHEFAYGGTTEPTVNPWNRGRLVGGSSGGPAAALAAGLAPLALGSDTAGSIRIPANLCGVVGFKPTNGMVSAAGVVPLAPSLDVVGPMGHHPRDLALAMGVLGGERFRLRSTVATRAVRRKESARSLRIAYLSDPGRMTPGAATAFEQTIELASEIGRPSAVHFEGFADLVMTNFTILGVEAAIVHQQWADQRGLYSPYVRERLEQAAATLAVDYEQARRAATRYRAILDRLLDGFDVLIAPGIPYPAPRLGVTTVSVGGAREDRDTSMCRNTGFANVTGHPSLAVPVSFEGGLPVGVQLVARRGDDAALLAIGDVFVRRHPVPTVAPGYSFDRS